MNISLSHLSHIMFLPLYRPWYYEDRTMQDSAVHVFFHTPSLFASRKSSYNLIILNTSMLVNSWFQYNIYWFSAWTSVYLCTKHSFTFFNINSLLLWLQFLQCNARETSFVDINLHCVHVSEESQLTTVAMNQMNVFPSLLDSFFISAATDDESAEDRHTWAGFFFWVLATKMDIMTVCKKYVFQHLIFFCWARLSSSHTCTGSMCSKIVLWAKFFHTIY